MHSHIFHSKCDIPLLNIQNKVFNYDLFLFQDVHDLLNWFHTHQFDLQIEKPYSRSTYIPDTFQVNAHYI